MANYVDEGLRKMGITISKPVLAVICMIFGVTVIVFPSLLVWIVGLFLIIQGALLLTDYFEQEARLARITASNGLYCSNCGARNTGEALYCKRCGKQLSQTAQAAVAHPQEIVQQAQS